jgi:hypothetical protein
LTEHGVVCWRRIDLARVIEQRYGVKFAERSIGDFAASARLSADIRATPVP